MGLFLFRATGAIFDHTTPAGRKGISQGVRAYTPRTGMQGLEMSSRLFDTGDSDYELSERG